MIAETLKRGEEWAMSALFQKEINLEGKQNTGSHLLGCV